MAKTLGIFVSSDKHLDYVIGLTGAAHTKGIDVQIFFTGKGVLLTQSPELANLVGKARMALCEVSFRALGLERNRRPERTRRYVQPFSGQRDPLLRRALTN